MLTKPEPGMPAEVVLPDGRRLPLRYTLRVLKNLKQDHGIDMIRNGKLLSDLLTDPASLAIILAEGLRVADPTITADWIEDNIEVAMLEHIGPALIYAATGNWVDLREVSTGQARPNGEATSTTDPPTGSDSGLLVATTSGSQNGTSGG